MTKEKNIAPFVPRPKTADQWAARIRETYARTVEGIIRLGADLLAAKESLDHGEFHQMINEKLPFGPRQAQRLMVIAADPVLSNATNASRLPCSINALYEVAKGGSDRTQDALDLGVITPQTTAETAWKAPPQRSEPGLVERMAASVSDEAAQERRSQFIAVVPGSEPKEAPTELIYQTTDNPEPKEATTVELIDRTLHGYEALKQAWKKATLAERKQFYLWASRDLQQRPWNE